jgi:diaminopimelate decarboxylase
VEEIRRVAARARALNLRGRVAFRVNPGVMADTHSHIATGHDAAKFGIGRAHIAEAWDAVDREPALTAVGVSTHVGSMLKDPEPYLASARVVAEIAKARQAQKGGLEYIDFGGGFGIDYGNDPASEPSAFVRAALALLSDHGLSSLRLVIEPGRSLVGPFGALVANVIQTKQNGERRWVMIDAGMNDLLRPALYGAKHRIEPLDREPGGGTWQVVGPVCESTDDFGAHDLGPEAPQAVVIRDAGAYGFVMASEYNGRPLPAEVFVQGGRVVKTSVAPGKDDWVRRRLEA